jgi:hypothetical protein
MATACLTRIVRFSASRLNRRSDWNAERSRVAFGSSGSEHALAAHERRLPAGVTLHVVRVQEDPTLYSEYRGE